MTVRISRLVSLGFVTVLAVLFLFPTYWTLMTSLKSASVTMAVPPELVPGNITLKNYVALFEKTSIDRWFLNSLFVSSVTMMLVCMTSACAGYAIAKKRFQGRNVVFASIMITLMIPWELLLIPQYELINRFGWYDTYYAIIVPAIAWPLGVFLLKQFMSTIPTELMEAAKIDGAHELGVFFKIIVPVAMPGISALAIFTFIASWNDYLWQLVVTNSDKMKTIQVGIAGLQGEFVAQYGLIMSGAMLSMLPMILIFILFQRYFTAGITLGAIKG